MVVVIALGNPEFICPLLLASDSHRKIVHIQPPPTGFFLYVGLPFKYHGEAYVGNFRVLAGLLPFTIMSYIKLLRVHNISTLASESSLEGGL